MQTNCFEAGPSGLRENGGLSLFPDQKGTNENPGADTQQTNTPAAQKSGRQMVGCHVRQFGGSSVGKKEESQWKEKTPW
jgi:hypothetical protein